MVGPRPDFQCKTHEKKGHNNATLQLYIVTLHVTYIQLHSVHVAY